MVFVPVRYESEPGVRIECRMSSAGSPRAMASGSGQESGKKTDSGREEIGARTVKGIVSVYDLLG